MGRGMLEKAFPCVCVCENFGECAGEKIACPPEILIKCLEGVGAGLRGAYGTCTLIVSVSALGVGGWESWKYAR